MMFRTPTVTDRIRRALAQAEQDLMDNRDRAQYHQAMAELNEHQALAVKYRVMAEMNEGMIDRYRSELDMIESRRVASLKKVHPAVQFLTRPLFQRA